MKLVADRFIEDDRGRAYDAATCRRVRLETCQVDRDERVAWAVRCDMLHSLRHRAVAPLIDYGQVGARGWFEAWGCADEWRGAHADADCMQKSAMRFLGSIGIDARGGEATRVCVGCTGAPTVVPLQPLVSLVPGEPDRELAAGDLGVSSPVMWMASLLAPMCAPAAGLRPRVAAAWGPAGSGRSMVAHHMARIARVAGFVPVDARLLGGRYAELWRGRSLFVLARGADGWLSLLRAVTAEAAPHAVLVLGDEEPKGITGIALRRVPAQALIESVVPAQLPAALVARVEEAAERSRGLPMRFARLLWGVDPRLCERQPRVAFSRAAESRAAYGENTPLEAPTPSRTASGLWASPRELASLRWRMTVALRLLSDGRHAPGIRQLRQAVGGLARRDAWSDAAEGALAVAAALLRRGRPSDAHAALDEARNHAVRGGHETTLLDVAILSGHTWIDRARLDEAETTLAAAVASARAGNDATRLAAASIGLARCMFWRGRYADAAAALPPADTNWPAHLRVRWSCVAARVHVGLGDVPRAVAIAADLLNQSETDTGPAARATAACLAAFVHLAASDAGAVERFVRIAIEAARAARDPLQAMRARLILAELSRRRGSGPVSSGLLRRMDARGGRIPPLVAARAALLKDLITCRDDCAGVVARHVAVTGLGALALFAPGKATIADRITRTVADDIVGILRTCQNADDEAAILKEVCGRVRRQVRALGVACVLMTASRREIIAVDGPRFEPSTLDRVAAASIPIAPHQCDGRTEAAAPVQYGGRVIGALCARWPPGSTEDLSLAPAVLSVAAAAVAPVLSASSARCAAAPLAASDLLGMTPTIAELKHAIARAAAAPFPVLVEGESGAGKEIVARAIHRGSQRRDRAFCTINCAALPDDLIEAELFGHARGAFTGALTDRTGVFEEAHGGTLLLDEVGELSLRAQAKLLRVIQEGEIRRVGENLPRRVDVRIVAATNRDLRSEVGAGRFRLDLLYRLDVVRISVPALRDRPEDISVLAEHFWREATARIGSRAVLSAHTLAALGRYDWPGNVRELQNVLASLAVRSPKRGVVPPTALPPQFGTLRDAVLLRLDDARREFEHRFVRAALVRTGGHRGRAAEELGVSRQGLTKLMARLGIGDREPASG